MQPWAWVLLIVVLVVVVLVVVAAMRRRRTENLRERFGPEYDRAVEASDDRRNAEQDLLDRARRRDQLDIRPLPEAARARYSEQWRGIQERFIDDPAGSVGAAHALLDQVMAERGYPTTDFEEQADLVSVDHPRVVENYRAAYGVVHPSARRPGDDRGPARRARPLPVALRGTPAPGTTARRRRPRAGGRGPRRSGRRTATSQDRDERSRTAAGRTRASRRPATDERSRRPVERDARSRTATRRGRRPRRDRLGIGPGPTSR